VSRSLAAGLAAASAVVIAGCGSASESTLEKHFRQGLEQIRTTNDKRQLRARLRRTVMRLRQDDARDADARTARERAIAGFHWTREALESEIAFVENDSGNLPVATRDAARGYHLRLRGARLLRAAGRLLGVDVGSLNGY
jgi:hypothetical protein